MGAKRRKSLNGQRTSGASPDSARQSCVGVCPICRERLYRDFMTHILARHPKYQTLGYREA